MMKTLVIQVLSEFLLIVTEMDWLAEAEKASLLEGYAGSQNQWEAKEPNIENGHTQKTQGTLDAKK